MMTPAPAAPAELAELAEAAGVDTHWIDAKGAQQTVAPDTLRAVLQALDLPCASRSGIRDSRAALTPQTLASRTSLQDIPPLLVMPAGRRFALPFACPADAAYRVELEHGGRIDGQLAPDHGGRASIAALTQIGYHRLCINDMSTTLAVTPARCFGLADALAAPQRPPGSGQFPEQPARAVEARHDLQPRSRGSNQDSLPLWGLAAQLYALRRDGDGGLADYTALAHLAQAAADRGAAALAVSPVHAMFSADCRRVSPYSPSSRLFLNVMHVDPAAVAGPQALAAALDGLGADARRRYAQLEQADMVDWPQAGSLRLTVLRQLYRQFRGLGGAARSEFDAFRQSGGTALSDHARFEALHASLLAQADTDGEQHDWRRWPAPLRDPRSPAVSEFASRHAEEIEFHTFLQWQAARGLGHAQATARAAGMPVGLIADLAVGADVGGSQAWCRQQEMIEGLAIGAPPDALNALGQNWGLGAFSPHALRSSGYRAYIDMLRAVLAHAGGIRIDHVLGLARLWLVPEGAAPTAGAYLRYPLSELLGLLALESWRQQAIVIGEDLGTIPPGFRDQLAGAGILGIRVLLFEREHSAFKAPQHWSPDAIATTTTHDTPTLAGWWQGRDIDWREQLGLLEQDRSADEERAARHTDRLALWRTLNAAGCIDEDADALVPKSTADLATALPDAPPINAALKLLGKSAAPLVMLPLEDALALPEQPNLPGTIDAHPNWRRRLSLSVGRILQEPGVVARIAALRRARAGSRP